MFKPSSYISDLECEESFNECEGEECPKQDSGKRMIAMTNKEYSDALENAKEHAIYGASRGWDDKVNAAFEERWKNKADKVKKEALNSASELLKTQWPAAANVIKEFAKLS